MSLSIEKPNSKSGVIQNQRLEEIVSRLEGLDPLDHGEVNQEELDLLLRNKLSDLKEALIKIFAETSDSAVHYNVSTTLSKYAELLEAGAKIAGLRDQLRTAVLPVDDSDLTEEESKVETEKNFATKYLAGNVKQALQATLVIINNRKIELKPDTQEKIETAMRTLQEIVAEDSRAPRLPSRSSILDNPQLMRRAWEATEKIFERRIGGDLIV